MKRITSLKVFCILLLSTSLILSCKKNDTIPEEPGNPTPPGQPGSINADTVANHFLFMRSTKKTGSIPHGPSGNSLKISFKDTLFLVDEHMIPFKFLHEDTTENVAGVYIQVKSFFGGSGSTFYYDVPELSETASSDTVSVIMMGIRPDNLIPDGVPPAGSPSFSFECTFIPYKPGGQPIAEAIKIIKVVPPVVDLNGSGGGCGLITQPGDYWDWSSSYISDPNNLGGYFFYNSPDKIWGSLGQNIKGSCCGGISVYGYCTPGDTTLNSVLHFNTFFTYTEEIFKFIENGTFVRLTGQFSANPDPRSSDFCGSDPGIVTEVYSAVTYYGNWTIHTLTTPIDGDKYSLSLQGTSSTGGGYGNPGGRIHVLNCYMLMLIQPDNEGQNMDLVKIYHRRLVNSPYWTPFT